MASNEGEDSSQDLLNSDEGKSFKVIGGCLRSSSTFKVGRKLACKFRGTDDTERENFEAEVRRFGSFASSCHAGKSTELEGAVEREPQLVTVSSQVFPDHNEFVPQDLDEGNLESVESVDSLKALLQEERLLYQTRITDLEREKEEQAENLKLKLFNEEKEKNAWRKRFKQLEARTDKLDSELKEKNKELSDQQEQIADLMRHLETQQAIASAPDETRRELQDGKVFLVHQPKKTGRKKSRKR
ncbi:uncharacterized protein LOC110052042 [Orbicella faveolata]|uniref:uncharacterized protein LOC110052042 n=1 Tax=Orbicella faveolata TaxID=48498 RepID=UPI0009E61CA4|nr:uncharacterized protein LOC110052042 [Orbicella faveolata]